MTFDQAFQAFLTSEEFNPADKKDLAQHAMISKRHAKIIERKDGSFHRVTDADTFQLRRTKQLAAYFFEAGRQSKIDACALPDHITICREPK